jgi:Flp pilus assembly protein TadG
LLFILIFGTFEFTRIMMVKQGMTNAAREGCRKASLLTTTTTTACESVVRARLDGLVAGANDPNRVTVSITPPVVAGMATQTPITTSITIPYQDVSILPGWLSGSAQLTVSATMNRE